MVILGLGSNIEDRLANLRAALNAITHLNQVVVKQISPVYWSQALLPENAPPDWDKPYLNLALRIETSLAPLDLLQQLKNIEWTIGRKPCARHWGPRVLDIDILAWDDRVISSETLTIPHESLQERPFALWPLADVAPMWVFPLPGPNQGKTAAEIVEKWGSRFTGQAPFHTKQLYQRVDAPHWVGIINVTPDSFSDGGKFCSAETVRQQALHLVACGADVIDIGAESTSPTAQCIDAKTEWARLQPALMAIHHARADFVITPKISVDTRHHDVAAKALALGVDWINDVSGLDNPAMRNIVADANVDCVVMHHLSIPECRNNVLPRHQDSTALVLNWAEKRLHELEQQGIKREKIIFDPGIGFGKMAEQSLYLLKNVAAFQQLGVRLLLGPSRKTFLSLLSSLPFSERDTETLAVALYLAKQQVDYLRVHNVEMCARGLRVMKAL